MIDEDGDMLAAEHVLGLLAGEERRAFERRLAAEPALRAARAAWEERLAALARELPETAPPARVRRALQRRLFADRPRARRSLAGWAWGLGGMASAALVAGLLILSAPEQEPGLRARIAAPDDTLVLAGFYSEGSAILHLRREAGAARPGRSLQLWLVAPGEAPVSLGLLPEARDVAIRVPEALRASVAEAVLAISDERPGGSPTGQPTSDPIAVGGIVLEG